MEEAESSDSPSRHGRRTSRADAGARGQWWLSVIDAAADCSVQRSYMGMETKATSRGTGEG